MDRSSTRRVGGDVHSGLREAMRLLPQGVTVVTTQTEDGPRGITVSSFTSVSLSPPLVLVSIARSSDLHDVFVQAKSFAVNLLANDQRVVSDIFAGKVRTKDLFGGTKFHKGRTGSPIIDGVRAAIECNLHHVYDGGDHSIILGRVVRATALGRGRPLVYYAQQYTTTEPPGESSLRRA